jgi:uncharacterized protein YraI
LKSPWGSHYDNEDDVGCGLAGILAVTAFSVLPASATTTPSDEYCSYTTTGTATFRTGPGTAYSALYTVPSGTHVVADTLITNGYREGAATSKSSGWVLASVLGGKSNCFE